MYNCKFCDKECKNKNSLAQHELRCAKNPNKLVINWKPWNKGKTKDSDTSVLKISTTLKKTAGYSHYNKYLQDNSIAYGIHNMQCYKKYFLEEQAHKCAICSVDDIWQDKKLVFVLDHIDGNANNKRENLRLICPNCNSQLPTFKSKNKYSARKNYRKKYYINK